MRLSLAGQWWSLKQHQDVGTDGVVYMDDLATSPHEVEGRDSEPSVRHLVHDFVHQYRSSGFGPPRTRVRPSAGASSSHRSMAGAAAGAQALHNVACLLLRTDADRRCEVN